jgi:aldehyde:ferredoxin oxidoreductase
MITGCATTPGELKQAGERITNLKKLFNIREGWTRADDTLPPRILEEKLPTGMAAGVGLTRTELEYMIDGYYRARGWTAGGLVPESLQTRLGLTELAAAPGP